MDDGLEKVVVPREAPILLVSKPGHIRDGLESLLGAMPGLPPLVTADSVLLALKWLRELSRCVPVPGRQELEGD